MNPSITPIKSTTQNFLSTEDIDDDVLILKDGSCAMVIETTATNFGLLSEQEQDAAIYSYGALLNSLSFTIQIMIRSRRKDVTSYLKLLETQEGRITRPEVKAQIRKYRNFITNIVQMNNVLEKKFYIILPMSALELGITKTVGSVMKKGQQRKGLPYPKQYILEKARSNLYPKRDHIFRLLNRLGLKPRQLNSQELIRLLFDIYNRDSKGQELASSEEYQTAMVKPAAQFKQPIQLESAADQGHGKPASPPPPLPKEAEKEAVEADPEKTPPAETLPPAPVLSRADQPVRIKPPKDDAETKPEPSLTKPDDKIQSKIDQLINTSTPPEVAKKESTNSQPIFQAKNTGEKT